MDRWRSIKFIIINHTWGQLKWWLCSIICLWLSWNIFMVSLINLKKINGLIRFTRTIWSMIQKLEESYLKVVFCSRNSSVIPPIALVNWPCFLFKSYKIIKEPSKDGMEIMDKDKGIAEEDTYNELTILCYHVSQKQN